MKYANAGDYQAQCKLATRYQQEYDKTKLDESFENAYKWYKKVIRSSKRGYETHEMKELVELLKKRDSAQYSDEIRKLERKIKHEDTVASNEYEYRMRYR